MSSQEPLETDLHIRIKTKQKKRLEELAAAQNRTLSQYLRILLDREAGRNHHKKGSVNERRDGQFREWDSAVESQIDAESQREFKDDS